MKLSTLEGAQCVNSRIGVVKSFLVAHVCTYLRVSRVLLVLSIGLGLATIIYGSSAVEKVIICVVESLNSGIG